MSYKKSTSRHHITQIHHDMDLRQEALTLLLANKKGADQHVHPHSPKSAHLLATSQRVVALAATTRWYSISESIFRNS